MAEIIARFMDGRLLVREDTTPSQNYLSGGVKVRVGLVRTVESIISIDAHMSGYPGRGRVETPLREQQISGDTVVVRMRRGDVYGTSSGAGGTSGAAAYSILSAITSGLAHWGELLSGRPISGLMKVCVNVIGY